VFNSGDLQLVNNTFALNAGTGGIGGAGGNAGMGSIFGTPAPGGNGGSGFGAVGDQSLCRITNVTFASNSGSGGAGGTGGVAGTTAAPGTPGLSGGGIRTTGGALVNALLAANAPGGNGSGTILDLGHNLSSDGSCAFTSVGSMNNTPPLLGPLTNNGGPTLTMALLPGSPTINAGDTTAAPTTDQRGFPRPAGAAADIGAYELAYPPVLRAGLPQAGTIAIQVFGTNGQTYRLLSSPDLSHWTPEATNQIGSDGTVLFYDNSGDACRFYRVVTP
jgi:hypothetical protein